MVRTGRKRTLMRYLEADLQPRLNVAFRAAGQCLLLADFVHLCGRNRGLGLVPVFDDLPSARYNASCSLVDHVGDRLRLRDHNPPAHPIGFDGGVHETGALRPA